MSERDAADRFVQDALRAALASAGLSIDVWPDMGADGQLPPYVVFAGTEGPPIDTYGNYGALRLENDFTYTVRATMGGNDSSLDSAEAAIQDALAGPFVSGNRQGVRAFQNGFVIDSKGSGGLSTVSPSLGRTFRYAGGRFLVRVRPCPAP